MRDKRAYSGRPGGLTVSAPNAPGLKLESAF